MPTHRKDQLPMNASDVQQSLDLAGALRRTDRPPGQQTSGLAEPIPNDIHDRAAQSLLEVLKTVAIPRLIARTAPIPAGTTAPDPQAGKLARLLVADDPAPAFAMIREQHEAMRSVVALCARVIEPTARRLGDLWLDDDCSELEVTLGLCRLQIAVRRAGAAEVPGTVPIRPGRRVLVAPQPGELHLLTAALDAEVLWRAGWDIACEFPKSDDAMQGLVAGNWFDALDLSLSAALGREDWLPRMARTISLARHASLNPALVVVVGGRVFCDCEDAGDQVGADQPSATALQTEWSILTARPEAKRVAQPH